jgi:hypothetical protein
LGQAGRAKGAACHQPWPELRDGQAANFSLFPKINRRSKHEFLPKISFDHIDEPLRRAPHLRGIKAPATDFASVVPLHIQNRQQRIAVPRHKAHEPARLRLGRAAT